MTDIRDLISAGEKIMATDTIGPEARRALYADLGKMLRNPHKRDRDLVAKYRARLARWSLSKQESNNG